jgi:hypothetical protein
MSMAKKSLSPEAQMRVQIALNQTDWAALLPEDRLTKHRAQREQLEALARQREATALAR